MRATRTSARLVGETRERRNELEPPKNSSHRERHKENFCDHEGPHRQTPFAFSPLPFLAHWSALLYLSLNVSPIRKRALHYFIFCFASHFASLYSLAIPQSSNPASCFSLLVFLSSKIVANRWLRSHEQKRPGHTYMPAT